MFLPERMWSEVRIEPPRRIAAFVRHRKLPLTVGADLTSLCLQTISDNVVVLEESIYSALEDAARARSQRDPADWPVVATALALSAGIWTGDNDFLGCGVPTWTTVTLQTWLGRHPDP